MSIITLSTYIDEEKKNLRISAIFPENCAIFPLDSFNISLINGSGSFVLSSVYIYDLLMVYCLLYYLPGYIHIIFSPTKCICCNKVLEFGNKSGRCQVHFQSSTLSLESSKKYLFVYQFLISNYQFLKS